MYILNLFSAAIHLIHGEISAANTNRTLASFRKTYIHILYIPPTHPYTIYIVYIIHYLAYP